MSTIHWIGLFAEEFISKWTVVWRFQEWFDQRRNDQEFKKLPQQAQDKIIFYWYYNASEWWYILDGDDSRFTNHSITPNIKKFNNLETAAIKDIDIWEEITENYQNFDELISNKNIKDIT